MKKYTRVIALFICAAFSRNLFAYFTMNQNDPAPMFTTLFPYGFLNENFKEREKEGTPDQIDERMRLVLTPFAQKADMARDIEKAKVYAGDVYGRWNMLGLTYGVTPVNSTLPATLQNALNVGAYQDGQPLDYEPYTDTKKNLGFFSVPLKYQKVGFRYRMEIRLISDLVFIFQGGVANIKQIRGMSQTEADIIDTDNPTDPLIVLRGPFIDPGRELQRNTNTSIVTFDDYYGTPTPVGVGPTPAPDIATIERLIMQPYQDIFDEMGLNINNFGATGSEDVYLGLVWRHNFFMNTQNGKEWAPFIVTPFVRVAAVIGVGKEKDQSKIFSLPFGNDGHHGIVFNGGMSFDFYETIEVCWEAGSNHFFKRDIGGMFVPNSELQSGIYPFKTNVTVAPGKVSYFTFSLHAYHFIEKLSFYAEYLFANHSKNTITLLQPDPAFKPESLENITAWKTQLANVAFNYTLAPHLTIGVLWQAPLSRRTAYTTNTIAISLAGTF